MASPKVTGWGRSAFFGDDGIDYDDLDPTLQHDVKSAQCIIPLSLGTLREIATNDIQNLAAHGGILASDSVPSLKRANAATDKALRVTWAAGESDEVQFDSVPIPPDLDPDADVIVHLMLKRSGTTDDCKVDVLFWENEGDTECGGLTEALTDTALTEVNTDTGSSTVAHANISGHPGFFNVGLVPAAHTSDILYLYSAWIEYTRKLRTS